MPTETLQQKSSNNKNGKFLSNKKILIIVFAFLVMIGLVVVSVTSILHEFSFSKLLSDVHDAFVDSKTRLMASIMLCLLILFFFFKFFNMTVPYMIRLKHLGIKVSSKDATLYYLTSLFFSAISPSILITEPYTMFWLKTQGVTTAQATALIWINEFINHTILIIITLPAFIWLTTQFNQIIAFNSGEGWTVIILASVGMGIDIFMFSFYIVSGFSKKVHYYLSRTFNWTKKILHLHYHTKSQTYSKYISSAFLYRYAKHYLKQYKDNVYVLLCYLFTSIIWFVMVYASLVLVHYQGADFFNGLTFIKVIGNVAVITTANRYLPLPGGEGTMQLQMHILLSYENKTTDSGVDNAIFTWRFFTAYLPAIYGIGGFCFYLSSFAKSVKNKKPIFKK